MRKKNINETLQAEISKYKRYCKKCGHPIIFPPTSRFKRRICVCCGYFIYKNDLEEFKAKMVEKHIKNISKMN